MAITSYIAPLLGGAVLMTGCYALGRFGYSIGWIWIFIVLNFVKSKLWKQREKRILSLRQTAMMEKEVVLAHLQDLPAWVQFPDTERVEWINKVILQLWPFIGEYTKQFIKEFIEPQVKASMPGPFKSFRFESMDMGDIPLRVGGIKVYTENVGRDRIIMDMDVMYAGDCDFVVSVGAFKGGLNQMQFSGKLRCILKPLLAYPPMVGGVSAFLLDDPILDFNLTGLGELVELPGLMDVVRSVVVSQIRAIAVLPNEIVVPLTAETDVTRLHFPEPDGVVRIHAYEAKNLENRDMSFIKKGKSDPYCHFSVGAQLFKTKVVDNDLNPRWDEFFEAVVDQASGQKLLVEVFDEDPGCNDEELGRLRVDLSTVQEKGVIDTWYPLEGAKHGDIHLKLYWMQLTSNPEDLHKLEQDQRWMSGKSNLHPAMLMVYIDNVSDLPYPKHNREPSPYIEVTLGNETKKTFPKPSTVNPIYQQKFLYFVSDADNQVLHVEAKDDSGGRSLGEVSIGLKNLLKEDKMELYQHTWSLSLQAHQAPIVMTLRLRGFALGKKAPIRAKRVTKDNESTRTVENRQLTEISLLADGAVPLDFPVDSKLNGGPDGKWDTPRSAGSSEAPSGRESRSSGGGKLKRYPSLMGRLTNKRHHKRRDSIASVMPGELGRLEVTIRYSFQRNKLVVVVNQAERLRPVSSDSCSADPYVKVKLLKEGSVIHKGKTRLALETLNPTYDETVEFDVHHETLDSCSLLIKVKDGANYGLFSSPPLMGMVTFSLTNFDQAGTSVTHWLDLKAS